MSQLVPIVQLEVHHHDKIFLSTPIATINDEKHGKGDLVIEGPYLTMRMRDGKRASINLRELGSKLLENLE